MMVKRNQGHGEHGRVTLGELGLKNQGRGCYSGRDWGGRKMTAGKYKVSSHDQGSQQSCGSLKPGLQGRSALLSGL